MKPLHQKVIDSKNTATLPNKYKGISVTIGLSLLLHIILLVKVGLPFNQHNSLRNVPLQVKVVSNSSNETFVEKKPSIQDIPKTNKSAAKPQERSAPELALAAQKSQTTIQNEFIKEPLTIQEPNLEEASLKDSQQPATTITSADQLIPANEVNLIFTIVSVNDGKTLGEAEQHFTSDGRNTYQLSISNKFNDTSGSKISDDTNEAWSYQIDGRVFGNRLSPSFYDVKGIMAERMLFLSRETNNGTPVTETPTGGNMPDGLLDRQSLLYQFMFKPPKDTDSKLVLSDGSRNSTFIVHTTAIEIFDSEQLGKVRVVHILMSNIDNNETIELWLAPSLKYLPIKVRHKRADNNTTDLLLSNLSIK